MSTEQPQGDSEQSLLERLGSALEPTEAPEDQEAVEASQSDETDDETLEQDDEQPESKEDGLVELELDGKVVRVDPEIKEGYLRQSDYTRKTQDLAALTKQAQAALSQQQLLAQFNEVTREDQERLAQIKGELSRYKKIDLTNLDTDQYIKTKAYIDSLKDDAADLEKEIGKKADQVKGQYQQQRNAASRSAYEFISRHVKDWQPGSRTESEVAQYASSNGIPPEVLAELAVMYPATAVALYKASQFDKLQATKGTIVQKAQKAPPVVKPGAVQTNQGVSQRYRKDREALKTSGSRDAGIRIFERLLSKG